MASPEASLNFPGHLIQINTFLLQEVSNGTAISKIIITGGFPP